MQLIYIATKIAILQPNIGVTTGLVLSSTISGPWWLIQLWLNLYMHRIVRPDLRNLSFCSSNFAEDYKGKEGRVR